MSAGGEHHAGEPPARQPTRRQFLRGVARSGAMAGLAVLGIVLGGRKRSTKRSETCANQGICRGCPAFDGCGLPQALSAKHAAAES
ncbi:MAG TPA: twin-arginine translocation signal domain-containing protein [Phycisphaerae bacterium]|nr:twin-arginine translocation signal domain-containing protein [Phycisphaerae bacterium]